MGKELDAVNVRAGSGRLCSVSLMQATHRKLTVGKTYWQHTAAVMTLFRRFNNFAGAWFCLFRLRCLLDQVPIALTQVKTFSS
jgi:hypothetical protein